VHAGPNESSQQDRFIVTHPTEPVQAKGNKPVQGSGAHLSIPNIYLATPKRCVIKVVKQGRDHSSRRSQPRLDKVGAQFIEPFARAQPELNQFDFRNVSESIPGSSIESVADCVAVWRIVLISRSGYCLLTRSISAQV
jgi:hypothetical protein